MLDACQPAQRPLYTPAQVQQYFDRIHLPLIYRASPVLSDGNLARTSAESLTLLSALIKYQLCSIPFENLDLHYSQHRTISLDAEHLFHKIVERGSGRGGWCMENSALFGTVLRSLGFDVMSTGGRVNEAVQPVAQGRNWKGPKFDGWNHMVNIVTISGRRYLVDVGFSSFSPTFPVPFEADFSSVNVPEGLFLKLEHRHIPDNTHHGAGQLLWQYNIRFNEEMDWLPGYCFSEVEFTPSDFEVMNFFVSNSPKSWFTWHVVALKSILDEETEEVVGDVTLFDNEIKERRRGVSRVLMQLASEDDRIRAQEEFLGIRLTKAERAGILGTVTHLG